MVNTFLVDRDFRRSASKLDNRRLGKQRVEAQQILNILKNIKFLAGIFSIPLIDRTSSRSERSSWIRSIVTTYKNTRTKAILVRNDILTLYYEKSPRKIRSGNQLVDSDGIVYELSERGKIVSYGSPDEYVYPGDNLITIGFMNHPAVAMWYGYEDALRDYINAHIKEWIFRGYKNTMIIHNVLLGYERPQWTFSDKVIHDFQASLLHREIERRESPWYLYQDDFVSSWAKDPEQFKKIIKDWYSYIDTGYLLSFGVCPELPWS